MRAALYCTKTNLALSATAAALAAAIAAKAHDAIVAIFLAAMLATPAHLMRAAITRKLPTVATLLMANILAISAAHIAAKDWDPNIHAAMLVAAPIVSWFGYWALHFGAMPPRAGESMRPPKSLTECNQPNKCISILVLFVEFVQYNALAFNPNSLRPNVQNKRKDGVRDDL